MQAEITTIEASFCEKFLGFENQKFSTIEEKRLLLGVLELYKKRYVSLIQKTKDRRPNCAHHCIKAIELFHRKISESLNSYNPRNQMYDSYKLDSSLTVYRSENSVQITEILRKLQS